MDQRSQPHLIEKGIRIQCNTENFVPIVFPGLSTSSSSSFPSSTSTTPSRQEIDHPASSSSSSTSPTRTVSSDSEMRAQADMCETDSDPASVSSSRVERKEPGDPLTKPTKSPKPKTTKTTKKNEETREIPKFLDGCKNSGKISWMTEFLNAETHTPIFGACAYDLGKHSVSTLFPQDRNCEICQRTKITRAPCRRRNGGAVPRAENVGDLKKADHKVPCESCKSRNNHRYAIVVQDVATQWIQAYPCKTKTSQETQRSLQKFLEPERNPKVIYTDNSLEFGKACEDLSWNHCTSTPHRSETSGIAERAVRRVKEGTSVML